MTLRPGIGVTCVLAILVASCGGRSAPVPGIHAVVQRIPLMGGPSGVAVAPNGRFCVALAGDRALACGRLEDSAIVETRISLLHAPSLVGLNGDGSTAYTTTLSGTIDVIDVTGAAVDASIILYSSGTNLLSLPNAALLYVSDALGNVYVVNTNLREAVDTFSVGRNAFGLALDTARKLLYVSSVARQRVSVVSTVTDSVVGTYATDRTPARIALTPDGRTLLVTDARSGLRAIDLQSRAVKEIKGVSYGAGELAVSLDGTWAIVAIPSRELLQIVDLTRGEVVQELDHISAQSLTFTPHGASVLVASANALLLIR